MNLLHFLFCCLFAYLFDMVLEFWSLVHCLLLCLLFGCLVRLLSIMIDFFVGIIRSLLYCCLKDWSLLWNFIAIAFSLLAACSYFARFSTYLAPLNLSHEARPFFLTLTTSIKSYNQLFMRHFWGFLLNPYTPHYFAAI